MVERQKETNGTFSTVKIAYEYDGAGRLTREFRDVATSAGAFSTTGLPDSDGDFADTFTFDLSGNRVRKVHDEVEFKEDDDSPPTRDTQTAYTYNERDQLVSEGLDVNADHMPDPATATTHTYDANGSQISVTTPAGTTRYTWNLQNRLTGVDANADGDLADPGDTTITYDSAGVRIRQTNVGSNGTPSTTIYLNDRLNPTGYTKAVEERVNGR